MPGRYRASIGHNKTIPVDRAYVGVSGNDIGFSVGTGAAANPLIADGFEDGTLNAWTQQTAGDASSTWAIITGGAANGTKYLRSTLTYTSAASYRAEQLLQGSGQAGVEGGVLYYGVSIRVPATTINDPTFTEACCQYHPGGTAHWALRNNNGIWDFENHNFPAGGNNNMGVIVKDVWHRWIARFLWTTTNTGSVKLWLNPVSEATTPTHQATNIQTLSPTHTGITNYKMGCYKPSWSSTAPLAGISPRVYHHDNAKIGLAFVDVI